MLIYSLAVWTFFAFHSEASSIKPISLYGVAILGKLIAISQPIILSYRSSTLYGAAEQAVGTSAAVASLSIASIIAPQVSRFILNSHYRLIDPIRCCQIAMRLSTKVDSLRVSVFK